jgi:hypothetical protein
MSALTEALSQMAGQDLYLVCKPDIADFTAANKQAALVVFSKDTGVEISMSHDAIRLRALCGKLSHYFFGGCKQNLIIGWNIKNLFTYVLGVVGKPLHCDSKIFDLRILENYIGVDRQPPSSFEEAKNRLMVVVKNPSWEKLKIIWTGIYNPLSLAVVPELETIGIIKNKKRLHAYYEIAAQVNGRMKCSNGFVNCYNPHTMSEEDKDNFRPPDSDGVFVYLDIKHMEVSVLQWLSGDPKLKEILDSGQDLYDGIWKTVTTIDSNEEYRKKCKGMFLPVVYGLGANGLSEKNTWPISAAKRLIGNIYNEFSVALEWIEKQQNAYQGKAIDYFGRNRDVDEQYKVRNFVVQSPASILCLDKLIQLREALKGVGRVGMHVHDGYGVFTTKANIRQAADLAKKSLESESLLFPGLKLKVSCKSGEKLSII